LDGVCPSFVFFGRAEKSTFPLGEGCLARRFAEEHLITAFGGASPQGEALKGNNFQLYIYKMHKRKTKFSFKISKREN